MYDLSTLPPPGERTVSDLTNRIDDDAPRTAPATAQAPSRPGRALPRRVLLTVSGTISPTLAADIEARKRPRADYLEIARRLGADLLDYAGARALTGRVGSALEKLGGPNLVLAYACWRMRSRYRAILTDGEQVGLPLAALFKLIRRGRPKHVMITHVISPPKKTRVIDALRLVSGIDRFVVYCSRQREFVLHRWRLQPERVPCIPFMVDADFFDPVTVTPQPGPRPRICSVGLERRDYPTLLAAVDGLEVDLVVAAASPWSKQTDGMSSVRIPSNVTIRRFTQYELRQLYADCDLMVMPLQDVDFQAGVTAILEAMAMGKPVVCSRTSGQTDVIVDGVNGCYVPVGNASALRAQIIHLLERPQERARLGAGAREAVVQRFTLDRYTERLFTILQDVGCGCGEEGATTSAGGHDERSASDVASPRAADLKSWRQTSDG